MVDVADQDGSERRDEAREFGGDDGFSDDVARGAQPLARKNLCALVKVQSAESGEGVLEFGAGTRPSGSKVAGCDIEKLQDFKKLLGCEGAGSALDLAEAALRKVKPASELHLGPAALLS